MEVHPKTHAATRRRGTRAHPLSGAATVPQQQARARSEPKPLGAFNLWKLTPRPEAHKLSDYPIPDTWHVVPETTLSIAGFPNTVILRTVSS